MEDDLDTRRRATRSAVRRAVRQLRPDGPAYTMPYEHEGGVGRYDFYKYCEKVRRWVRKEVACMLVEQRVRLQHATRGDEDIVIRVDVAGGIGTIRRLGPIGGGGTPESTRPSIDRPVPLLPAAPTNAAAQEAIRERERLRAGKTGGAS